MSSEAQVRATYDLVAAAYDAQVSGELAGKPLDRALLTAFAEQVGEGPVADVGCGPGHVTRFLSRLHPDVVGLDLSPGMVAQARAAAPDLRFEVASMLDLPVADGAWAGAVACYSLIHLSDAERRTACAELARAVRPGGWLLVAFHVSSADFAAGEVNHATAFLGHTIDLDFRYLEVEPVRADLDEAGFAVTATLTRQGDAAVEHPSLRCSLLGRRRGLEGGEPAPAR